MLFHYGNCKQEIEALKKDLSKLTKENKNLVAMHTSALSENIELKAMYDYQTHELEKSLKAAQDSLKEKVDEVARSTELYEKLTEQYTAALELQKFTREEIVRANEEYAKLEQDWQSDVQAYGDDIKELERDIVDLQKDLSEAHSTIERLKKEHKNKDTAKKGKQLLIFM